MVIPHLMFAHMLADYVLQTNWLVARKGRSWYGLGLHGGIVGVMSLLALSPYLGDVWPLLVALTVVHTFQDYLKVRFGPHMKVHPFIPYMGDQLLHYITIIGIQWTVDRFYSFAPGQTEIMYMWAGTAAIAVTRYYDVTWWANWLDMIPYMNRWRALGYAERLAMVVLTVVGVWFLAPLMVLPRLWLSWRQERPVWRQRRGALEVVIGIAFSVAVGFGLRAVM